MWVNINKKDELPCDTCEVLHHFKQNMNGQTKMWCGKAKTCDKIKKCQNATASESPGDEFRGHSIEATGT